MLFKDGQKIDVKGDSPEAKDFQEKKKWVKDNIGFPVVFKANKSFISPQIRIDGGREKVEHNFATWYIPNIAFVKTSDGTEEWRWSPVIPKKKDGEYQWPRQYRNSAYTKPVFALNENEFDRIYFLMFKSEKFKRIYSVDDVKIEANKVVEQKIKEAKIYNTFYGENSILLKDEERLREIARAWNLQKVERLTKQQILQQLETAVREQDRRGIKSIDEFIEDTQLNEYTEVGALIQRAEDNEVIKFDDKVSMWYYLGLDGSYGDKICEVPKAKREHKYVVLRDYILVEKEHIGRIKSLSKVSSVPNEAKLDFNNLEAEDWEKVMAFCNMNGIATTGRGRTKKMVFDDILAFVKK